MRFTTTSILAVSAILLAAAPAMADDDFRPSLPNVPRPHVTVQIGSPTPQGVYVQPGYAQPGYGQYQYQQQQPGYGYGYGGGPGGGAWQDPGVFRNRMMQRLGGIRADLQERVQNGTVNPQAINEFSQRQQDIVGDINAAGRDGVISQDERQHIREDVDSLRFLEQRYHVQPAYGGGPRGWDDHDRW